VTLSVGKKLLERILFVFLDQYAIVGLPVAIMMLVEIRDFPTQYALDRIQIGKIPAD
jgi:hypothetical protein